MATIYQYPKCSTCRKAIAWLNAQGVELNSVDITEQPPSISELKRALKLSGLPLNKLFNTSGKSYRDGGFRDKLKEMSEQEALQALAADGKLIKRPLVLGKDFALVGFKEADYAEKF